MVYGSTYASANSTDTFCRLYGIPVEGPKFIIVSAVNIATTLIKDRALAKMFGTKAPTAIPYRTLGLWSARDCSTIMAAFILPQMIADRMVASGYNKRKSEVSAQFLSPLLLQFVTTPFHILGFDIYNDPQRRFSERLPFLKQEYCKSVGARMIRMTPAYGIGGVLNLYLM